MLYRTLRLEIESAVVRSREKAAMLGYLSPGQCMPLAMLAATEISRTVGVRSIIQAGSCHWPLVGPYDENYEQAESRGRTMKSISDSCGWFGWEWSPDSPMSVRLRAAGGMPEYHAWVAIPDSGIIIDSGVKEVFQTVVGRNVKTDFSGGCPPDFFIGTVKEIPFGVVYHAIKDAIDMLHGPMVSFASQNRDRVDDFFGFVHHR